MIDYYYYYTSPVHIFGKFTWPWSMKIVILEPHYKVLENGRHAPFNW